MMLMGIFSKFLLPWTSMLLLTIISHNYNILICHGVTLKGHSATQPENHKDGSVRLMGLRESNDRERLDILEIAVNRLVNKLSHLQKQNEELIGRVSYLETCDCQRSCFDNGTWYRSKQIWRPQKCTICECKGGGAICRQDKESQECIGKCRKSPCKNEGVCVADGTARGYSCLCPHGYSGPDCSVKINPCSYPPKVGSCNENVTKYFYSERYQNCRSYQYSGCGGSVNNFHTWIDCHDVCEVGACYHRNYNTRKIAGIELTILQPLIKCQKLNIPTCQNLGQVPQSDIEHEVISFHAGQSCRADIYESPMACQLGQTMYKYGEKFKSGCEGCQCLPRGHIKCRCTKLAVRKEIRNMSLPELKRFKNTLTTMNNSSLHTFMGDMANIYSTHVMQAQSTPFFLPWHRLYLRYIERKLQEINCDVTIPYLDFISDSRNLTGITLKYFEFFEESDANNDDYATMVNNERKRGGEDAVKQSRNKVIKNSEYNLMKNSVPSLIDVLLILQERDYLKMSKGLQTISTYFHWFYFKHFGTKLNPTDPIFLFVHAYIDNLYWTWQTGPSFVNNEHNYPSTYIEVPMMPFKTKPYYVLKSEAQLCVTYARGRTNSQQGGNVTSKQKMELHNTLWRILIQQKRTFLNTLKRSCHTLQPIPEFITNQLWLMEAPCLKGSPNNKNTQKTEIPGSFRESYCFDVSIFTLAMMCNDSYAKCNMNPCIDVTCVAYPKAVCTIDFCDKCQAKWVYVGKVIDCTPKKDYCNPSPCVNSGTCMASNWPDRPDLVTCKCHVGYQGRFCQFEARHRCTLPLDKGEPCNSTMLLRWYHNSETNKCEKFSYNGCYGNSNNFPSFNACRARCFIGACCYRNAKRQDVTYGYDPEGYDRYGFDIEGNGKES
ncbi:unnamed protein product, partial [Owenia fusiformis]